jgi:glycosyltransferase involved in cell wall biosynthesis
LYKRAARIKFVEEAFSIHVTALDQGIDRSKPVRSVRNFRRLFERHPELALVARRWARDSFSRICEWADTMRVDVGEDRAWLAGVLGPRPGGVLLNTRPKRYRVLTYRWHVPHQYEIYKLPFDFTLLTGVGSAMTEQWDYCQRPLPANAWFERADKINVGDFDFAILHFDENVLAHQNTNGVLGPEWGSAFQWFREHVALPKVAVCHGTPQFKGQYNMLYNEPDLMQVIEPERQRLVDYLSDVPVVCNSHQAQREWRFKNSRVIWHGFDPAEFPAATYERGIVSPLGPLVMSRPHYRGYFLYREVFDGYYDELKPGRLKVPEPSLVYSGNAYALAKYRNYVDELRRYSVYFNPTLRSPMPRARAEPMMCGVVPVSARNHDVEMFTQNGVNGFYGDSADELREQLRFLVRNPDAARKIGEQARLTAMALFNYDRFLGDWHALVRDVVG